MARDWTTEENLAIVDDYFAMLHAELSGVPVNKREHNRRLRALLRDRSPTAVERKHMNVSAVLRDLEHPWIDGYKPLPNYQTELWDIVVARITRDDGLALALKAVVAASATGPSLDDLLGILEPPPDSDLRLKPGSIGESSPFFRLRPVRRVDYLAQEARNQSLGRAGEELVLRYEDQRLREAGRGHLARRIEHVSASRGDGAGFDVLSFDIDGRERWIEVKTTGFGKRTPFYVSRNEVECSKEREDVYHLYRVFGYRASPRLFTLQGALNAVCDLTAVTYLGRVA